MKLSELLSAERIHGKLVASSRKKALEELSSILARGDSQLSHSEIFHSLVRRERLGNTALGNGCALPHGRVSGLDHCIGAFARLAKPIDFDSADGEKVDLLFGIVIPANNDRASEQTLSAVAHALSDPDLVDALRKAQDLRSLSALLLNHQGFAPTPGDAT